MQQALFLCFELYPVCLIYYNLTDTNVNQTQIQMLLPTATRLQYHNHCTRQCVFSKLEQKDGFGLSYLRFQERKYINYK